MFCCLFIIIKGTKCALSIKFTIKNELPISYKLHDNERIIYYPCIFLGPKINLMRYMYTRFLKGFTMEMRVVKVQFEKISFYQ